MTKLDQIAAELAEVKRLVKQFADRDGEALLGQREVRRLLGCSTTKFYEAYRPRLTPQKNGKGRLKWVRREVLALRDREFQPTNSEMISNERKQ